MQRILLLSLTVFVFALSACGSFQTVKDSWKYTQKQYRTYLNTPAELNLEDTGSCELYELALSEAVIDVDEELQKLIRAMENSDHNPDQMWVTSIMNRVPWLSGVALIDNSGAVVAQYPEYFSKPFDASPLVEPDPKQRLGALRAYVQMVEAGPEVYVGNPVYGGRELRGIIVAYFDPRALVTVSSDPGSFMIASPAGVLWPGRFGSGSIVGSTDWLEVLKRESCGIIGSKESEFFWTTRYVGNLPLVYALPTSAGQHLLPQETPAPDRAKDASASADPAGTDEAGVQPLSGDAEPRAEAAPAGDDAAAPLLEDPAVPLQPAGSAPVEAAGPEAAETEGDETPKSWPERAPDFTAPIQAPAPAEKPEGQTGTQPQPEDGTPE